MLHFFFEMLLNSLIIFSLILMNFDFITAEYYVAVKDSNNSTKIIQGQNLQEINKLPYIVILYLIHSSNETGWTEMALSSNPEYSNEEQTYQAGLVEGLSTAQYIYYYWNNVYKNYCVGKPKTCVNVKKFIKENLKWMNEKIMADAGRDPWWYQVSLFFTQLRGIVDGYNQASKLQLTFEDIYMLNILEDVNTLMDALADPEEKSIIEFEKTGSCSAFIKVTVNDIFFAHNTWTGYSKMNRILKNYNLKLTHLNTSKEVIPSTKIVLSSYPGVIVSVDDYYLLSSGLAAMETTNEIYNDNVYDGIHPYVVFETIRSFVANKLSTDGRSWCKNFARLNSGTYNNQWMILNFNQFINGSTDSGLLWVLEQLPEKIIFNDLTQNLMSHSYWASYNVPFYSEIYKLSGYEMKKEKYGNWYSHDECPRAKMFKRFQEEMTNTGKVIEYMRFNDYQHDNDSKCNCTPEYNACNAIAARCDLNPDTGKYPFSSLAHRMHGAIDVKSTNTVLFKKLQFIAVGGPTYSANINPFQWTDYSSKDIEENPHLGQVNYWDFSPILFDLEI